jgi:hypothetical protein
MRNAQSATDQSADDIISLALSAVVPSDASMDLQADLRAPVSRLGELLAVLAMLAVVAGVGALVVA